MTDFDGTLSPVIDDPASAEPLAGVVDVLHRLAGRYRRVAVVSGRPVSFLRDRLDIDRRPPSALFVSGLYGIEWIEDGVERAHPSAVAFRDIVARVADRAQDEAPAGVLVERKGLSVTLHVRTARDEAAWADAWAADAAEATGLVVHLGRMSFELRPPVALDKGTVVEGTIAGSAAACFIGDDLGDLPAFDALDRFGAAGGHAVRIGVRSAEAPPELLARSDLVVDGPKGALGVLESLG